MWLLQGGHVWDTTRYGGMVNERAVRILLECILVLMFMFILMLMLMFTVQCSSYLKSYKLIQVRNLFLSQSPDNTILLHIRS